MTETVPTSVETSSPEALTMLPSMLPAKCEPSVSSSVRLESLPTLIAPASCWAIALSAATLLPPLQPSAQTESRMSSASSLTTSTPSSVMTALVLVTWKTWPLLLVSVPPVIVKWLVPLAASPDMDW